MSAPGPVGVDVARNGHTCDPLALLLERVAREFGVSPVAIQAPGRYSPVREARLAFYLLALENTKCGTVEVGRFVGRTHGAVVKGRQRADWLRGLSKRFRERLNRIDLADITPPEAPVAVAKPHRRKKEEEERKYVVSERWARFCLPGPRAGAP